jgi:hypothetical protein
MEYSKTGVLNYIGKYVSQGNTGPGQQFSTRVKLSHKTTDTGI